MNLRITSRWRAHLQSWGRLGCRGRAAAGTSWTRTGVAHGPDLASASAPGLPDHHRPAASGHLGRPADFAAYVPRASDYSLLPANKNNAVRRSGVPASDGTTPLGPS